MWRWIRGCWDIVRIVEGLRCSWKIRGRCWWRRWFRWVRGSGRRGSCAWLRTLRGIAWCAWCSGCVGWGRFSHNSALARLIVCSALSHPTACTLQISSPSTPNLISLVCAAYQLLARGDRRCRPCRKRSVANILIDTSDNGSWGWNWRMCRWRGGRIRRRSTSIACCGRLPGHRLSCRRLCRVWIGWVTGRRFVVFLFVWFL